jgi:uncharacterized protein
MDVSSVGRRSGRGRSRRRSRSVQPLDLEDSTFHDAPGTPPLRAGGELLVSLFAGFVFAAGLVMSGMTQPSKVLAFLDVKEMAVGPFPGNWDASLAFVMGGAVMVTLVAFFATPRASVRPWFGRSFVLPRRERIDLRLVLGAIFFGIGWGLSGYCPGPAMATLLIGQMDTVIFVMAMLPGMWLARKVGGAAGR